MIGIRELNIAVEFWGVAFCGLGIVCVLFLLRADNPFRRLLLIAFSMDLITCGGDILAGMFRGQEGALAWAMVHGGNYATFLGGYLLISVLTIYLCLRIAEAGGPAYRGWRLAVLVLTGILCLLVFANAFFFIDEANLYHRSDNYWIGLACVVGVQAVNAALVLANRNKLAGYTQACLLFYSVAPIIAAVLQGFVYGINLIVIASVLGLAVMFLEIHLYTSYELIKRTDELARSQVEAAESRIAAMVSQIQPHFLFNSLDTIYGLVDEDSERAKEAIASFSRYLRTNLNSLKHTRPVPLEREMEHVRTYLELERMSDESRLDYELDIQATGFNVPALSVQTLVENAVKHGLGGREHGGKVIVRAREQANEYTVAIIDDGIGFNVEDIARAEGIGISNTRERLAAMCAGTLDVTSEAGVGTTVIMHIPKRTGRLES